MSDLGKYKNETNLRLILGAMILLFLVGDGLIFYIYGASSALMGLICMILGFVPILLVVIVLKIVDWSVKRANRE